MWIVSKMSATNITAQSSTDHYSDPLPFQFWHRYAALTEKATFVDVDYPQLIDKKRDVVFTKSLLRDALLKTGLRSAETPVRVRSERYMAIGCDLRDLELLERTLRSELDIPNSSILFVAEVSVTYMPLVDANKLIQWANTFEAGKSIHSFADIHTNAM
jgi:tRNA wybutosine-synthesizing protein 4